MSYSGRHSRRHRFGLLRNNFVRAFLVLLLIGATLEAYRAYGFYRDATAARDSLLQAQKDLDIGHMADTDAQVVTARARIEDALVHTRSARKTLKYDPLIWTTSRIPVIGTQVRGLQGILEAAQGLEETGLIATDISTALTNHQDDPNRTSVQEAVDFVKQQNAAMQQVNAKLVDLQRVRSEIPEGLVGPLGSASIQVDSAIEKVHQAVIGYARADALLPRLLGYNGPKRYLVLPQNDTELFPSGGLISSYAIVTFDKGVMNDMQLEYFGTLYDRWQAKTKEYIEPPAPLKMLKQNYSWSLGEAGWYPDFNKTAELSRMFVAKGGAAPTDGVIAIDLQFMQELIKLLGPVEVPEFKTTVTSENIDELTLELTRSEIYAPGVNPKAFLSYLSRAVINRTFTAPKDKWIDLMNLLERMSRERHLQLNFTDPQMQSLSSEYGLDGGLVKSRGDYLLVADTSIGSTKLHLILQKSVDVAIDLKEDGTAGTNVKYTLGNPFNEWKKGRDPKMVTALMLQGVYGSYTRVYAPIQAVLRDVRIDGKSSGAEQANEEVGKKAFGKAFSVLPGKTSSIEFSYDTPRVATAIGKQRHYELYIQKEAGTAAILLDVKLSLPRGAELQEVRIDRKHYDGGLHVKTDLREDRTIEVTYKIN